MKSMMPIRLAGGVVSRSARRAERMDLVIRRGRIAPFGTPHKRGPVIDVPGCLLLPGLINAHDHLEFSLFPKLGRGPYANATEWARDICHPDRTPVKEHLSVPKSVRLIWGGLKNLLVRRHDCSASQPMGGGIRLRLSRARHSQPWLGPLAALHSRCSAAIPGYPAALAVRNSCRRRRRFFRAVGDRETRCAGRPRPKDRAGPRHRAGQLRYRYPSRQAMFDRLVPLL